MSTCTEVGINCLIRFFFIISDVFVSTYSMYKFNIFVKISTIIFKYSKRKINKIEILYKPVWSSLQLEREKRTSFFEQLKRYWCLSLMSPISELNLTNPLSNIIDLFTNSQFVSHTYLLCVSWKFACLVFFASIIASIININVVPSTNSSLFTRALCIHILQSLMHLMKVVPWHLQKSGKFRKAWVCWSM